jgi:hypothetical protein
MRGAALGHAGKAGADLHALDGVDAHHGVGNVGVELVKQRLAQAHGHAAGRHADARAARIARLAQAVHVVLQVAHIGHRGKERVVRHMVPALERDGDLADLRHAAAKRGAILFSSHFLATAPAATMGAVRRADERPPPRGSRRPYFVQVGVVGMAGAEGLQRCRRSPCCAGRCCGSAGRSACRWSCPSYTPLRISTASGSLRWVTWRLVPGRRRSRSPWMSASLKPCRAGSRRSRSQWPGRGIHQSW